MPTFNIPEKHQQGFEYFIALKDNLRSQLIKEIEKAPIGLPLGKLSKELAEILNLGISKLEPIMNMIISLYSAKESFGLDVDSFVDGIIDALENTDNEKLKPTKNLRSQLIQILSKRDSFYFTFKANNLVAEREKLLLNTSILTDIRPVFSDEKDYKIKCSLIIHNLKIEFMVDDEYKEIYFALENEDLKKLKDIIVRAEEKEKAIREQFKSPNISFLDIN